MSNSVEAIISKVDSEFSEPPSFKSSVLAADGEIIRIPDDLWKKSPILREHSARGISHKKVAASKIVLAALIEAHEHGTFPEGVRESFDLLAAASELEFGNLTGECFGNLGKLKVISASVDFPNQLSIETVMRFFKVLLDSPLRTYEIYEEQLFRIARCCANNRDVMTNATNLLKQRLVKLKIFSLEGIPTDFETQTVPVAIYKRTGTLQTVVIRGTEVIPVNLFGSCINLESTAISDDFYLKYGLYLLYSERNLVYCKDIRDDSEPVEVLSDCCFFITRGNFSFALQGESNSISLWTEQRKFERIYQGKKDIRYIDFDHSTRVLAVQDSDEDENIRVLLFRLKGKTLHLLEERVFEGKGKCVTAVLLSGRDMFIVREDDCGDSWIETHRIRILSNQESSQPKNERPNGGEVSTKSKKRIPRGCALKFAGSYFLTYDGRLELLTHFPLLDETRTLMTDGELCALSELSMSP